METITSVLARRLRELRKRQGMRQEDLASAAGLSVSTITFIEREVAWVSPATISALARALDVPEAALFHSEEGAVEAGLKQSLERVERLLERNLKHPDIARLFELADLPEARLAISDTVDYLEEKEIQARARSGKAAASREPEQSRGKKAGQRK